MVGRRDIVNSVRDSFESAPVGQEPPLSTQYDGQYLYRGEPMVEFINEELEQGLVLGRSYPVVYMEMPESEKNTMHQASSPSTLPGRITNISYEPVTGGWSQTLGSGRHFGTVSYRIGLTAYMDPAKIDAKLTAVQYTEEYAQNHPEAVARIDDLTDAALVVNGEFWGLLSSREGEDVEDWPAMKWGRQAVARMTNKHYADEFEVVAEAEEVDVSNSIERLVTFAGAGTTTSTLNTMIDHIVEEMGKGARVARSFKDKPDDERAEFVYDYVWQRLPGKYRNDYALLVQSSLNDARKADRRVDPDNFEFVYDGDRMIRDYDAASEWVNPENLTETLPE